MHTTRFTPRSLPHTATQQNSLFIVVIWQSLRRAAKNLLLAPTLLAGIASAQSHAYVNVTVGGEFAPGVYGQVAIGNNPPPPVIYTQPVVIGTPVYGAPVVYMHVPPTEYREWGRYCGKYRVCGYPVQFVRVDGNERWWERPVARGPEWAHPHSEGRQDWRHGHRGHGHEEYRHEDRDH